jgi:hypothetical protein
MLITLSQFANTKYGILITFIIKIPGESKGCFKNKVTLNKNYHILVPAAATIATNRIGCQQDGKYKHNIEARSRNHCCREKAISITCSECMSVALVIQHAKRMRRIMWPVWICNIFSHYLINGAILGKTLLNIKCVFLLSLQLLSQTFLILRKIQRDIINVCRSSCKVPVILVGF